MIFLFVLSLNALIGHKDFKYQYLELPYKIYNILYFIPNIIIAYFKKHILMALCCIIAVTIIFGKLYYNSFDPNPNPVINHSSNYSPLLSIKTWLLIYICIFIDIPFYYRQKKIMEALKSDDFTYAKYMIRGTTLNPIHNMNDIYNEFIIWVTHNSLYKVFLPIFYYVLGDMPALLCYLMLYPLFKQLPKIHCIIVYSPFILLSIIGTILSAVAVITGSRLPLISELWGAILYSSKNRAQLEESNANLLSITYSIEARYELKYHSIHDRKLIDLPIVNKKHPSIESMDINNVTFSYLFTNRNTILPIYALTFSSFIAVELSQLPFWKFSVI